MRKFVEFEIHDYMDMYPRSSFRAMEESEAQNFADTMNQMYSGGTTRLKRVLTKEEAIQHTLNEIRDIVGNPSVDVGDGTLDSIDVGFIKTLLTELDKCYK